jgi:hypothetical protein
VTEIATTDRLHESGVKPMLALPPTKLWLQERAIEMNLDKMRKAGIEAAKSLIVIHDEGLYSEPTFKDYVRNRWGWTDSRARQIMAFGEGIEDPITGLKITTDNEYHHRALNPFPKEHRRFWRWQRQRLARGVKRSPKA